MAETPILRCNPRWAPRSDDVVVFIPEDLVSRILMCLPVKSIVRFKSVCWDWHRTISSKSFISSHLHRSKTNPTNLFIPSTYNEVSERIFKRDLLGLALRQNNAGMYPEVPSRIRMYRYEEAGRLDKATLFFETVRTNQTMHWRPFTFRWFASLLRFTVSQILMQPSHPKAPRLAYRRTCVWSQTRVQPRIRVGSTN